MRGTQKMTIKNVTPAATGGNRPTLHDYNTAEYLRPATPEEHRASIRAARFDGGAGVIVLDDGRRCYVADPCPATLPATAHTPLDLSIDCTGDDTGATWWECPICGDYAWLAPGQEAPECSCEGDPDTLPAAGRDADAWWAWHDADPSRRSPGETPTEGTEAAERRCAAWLRGESTDGPDPADLDRLRDVTDARIYSYEIVSGVEVYGLTDDGAKLARSLGFRVDVDSYGQAFAVGLVVRRTAKEVAP
jgi:hypothetical protein